MDRAKDHLRSHGTIYICHGSLIERRDRVLAPCPATGQQIFSDCSDVIFERREVLEVVALQECPVVLGQDFLFRRVVEPDEAFCLGLTQSLRWHSQLLMLAVRSSEPPVWGAGPL